MSHITLKDLEDVRTLRSDELSNTRGGFFFTPWYMNFRNVFNPYLNPYGFAIQQQTFQTQNMWADYNAAQMNRLFG